MEFYLIMKAKKRSYFCNKKTTRAVADYYLGKNKVLYLGNLDAKRTGVQLKIM